MKRLFDLICAGLGLLVLSPFLLLIAVAVKASSPGPVFFRGVRAGKDGKPFRMLKFRTMVADADTIGPGITSAADPRITSLGRWLRRTKLDELPQLINVVSGDMSLVGPRPEDPRYVELYTPEQRRILDVRPGITSKASVDFRSEEEMLTGSDWETVYRTQVLPRKLALDLEYMRSANLRTDFVLILRTLAHR